jgi:anti-sigma B factor antagonist
MVRSVGELPDPPELSVTARTSGEHTSLAVAGEMDVATADEFATAVREHLAVGPVVIELAELRFMDSSGVRALDGLVRDSEREGWSLAIAPDIHDNVRRVLSLTGVLDTLPLRDAPAS